MMAPLTKSRAGLVLLATLFLVGIVSWPWPWDFGSFKPWVNLIWSVFWFLVVPMLIIKFAQRRSLTEFGWRRPDWTGRNLWITIITTALLMAAVVLISMRVDMQNYYAPANRSLALFLRDVIFFSAIYYLAEEFLFRGWLTFSLWSAAKWWAIPLTAGLFAFAHLGKPAIEVWLSLVAGGALTYIAIRTKSFIPAGIIHFLMSIGSNVVVWIIGTTGTGFKF